MTPNALAEAPARTAPEARGRARTAVLWSTAALGAVLVLAAVLLRLHGGSWFVVQTPSMGTAAPVGTLVVTAPVEGDPLRVGDVIAFHPPTVPASTYTHRIAAIAEDGAITTRGDANGAADGWRLRPSDVVGRAVALLPGVGWLIRALPVLLVGLATVWIASGRIRDRERRIATRLTGSALVLTAVLAWLRPLVDVATLEVTYRDGVARALLVSTGLLPVRVSAPDGASVGLAEGQIHAITTRAPADGHYAFAVGLDLPWTGWLLLGAVWTAPILMSVVLARRRPRVDA